MQQSKSLLPPLHYGSDCFRETVKKVQLHTIPPPFPPDVLPYHSGTLPGSVPDFRLFQAAHIKSVLLQVCFHNSDVPGSPKDIQPRGLRHQHCLPSLLFPAVYHPVCQTEENQPYCFRAHNSVPAPLHLNPSEMPSYCQINILLPETHN